MKKVKIIILIGILIFTTGFLIFITYKSALKKNKIEISKDFIKPATKITSFIKLGTRYSELEIEGKAIVDNFINNSEYLYYYSGLEKNSEISEKRERVQVFYYDDHNAILCVGTGKIGCLFASYKIDGWIKSSEKEIGVSGNIVQSEKYIFVIDNSVKYLKFGELEFKDIPNSIILNKNETYISGVGPGGDEYLFNFDEVSKVLKATIFKSASENSNWTYTKLREVEFVLP